MSADNGVYILRTPARPVKKGNEYISRPGLYEYRVAHCQAIEDLDFSDFYMPLLFGDCFPFDSEENARKEAGRILDGLDVCEYGICIINKDMYFPNMSRAEAKKALDTYVCYEGTTRDCVACNKPLLSAQTDNFQHYQPLGGGEIQLIFTYGSFKFDKNIGSTRYRGIICDNCSEKLMPNLDEVIDE